MPGVESPWDVFHGARPEPPPAMVASCGAATDQPEVSVAGGAAPAGVAEVTARGTPTVPTAISSAARAPGAVRCVRG